MTFYSPDEPSPAMHRHTADCPTIENFRELDMYLEGAIIRARSIGSDAATQAFSEVRERIAHLVELEGREAVVVAHTDGVEAAWKAAGYASSMEVWRDEGR